MAFTIGVDYGTQSGRVVLLDLSCGAEVATAAVAYPHGVVDEILPGTGERLPPDWALQHPLDYLEVLHQGIPEVLRQSGVRPEEIIGLGIDFTSCTVLPVDQQGDPLCTSPEWADHRHAWPKLWKHHAAQPIADRINRVALAMGETFLSRYGGRISSEWYFPKLIELFEEDRLVYDNCYRFIEATDWIVWYLTGVECRNSCTAGYKAMWSDAEGVPSVAFFSAINPDFTNPTDKLGEDFYPLGTRAGTIRPEIATKLGLTPQVAVAVGNVDAMVSVPATGVHAPGSFVMVMGTSICHLALTETEIRLPGVTGVVKDGVLPGFYGYEAGQAAVGDMLEWFVSTQVPQEYVTQAEANGLSIYEYLEQRAVTLQPGEHGLLALDWWNGNRSILGDTDLTGVIIGLTLSTSVEEIYNALLASIAMGTRRIIENFREHGIVLNELVACGGLPQKSPLLMQMYADICGMSVIIRDSKEIPARGAAMYGAVAAGVAAGGYDSILEASERTAAPMLITYHPDEQRRAQYEELYAIYRELYALFGQDHVALMHRLKALRLKTAKLS